MPWFGVGLPFNGVMIQHWRISGLLYMIDRGRGYWRGIIGWFRIMFPRREGFGEQVAELAYKVVFEGGPTRLLKPFRNANGGQPSILVCLSNAHEPAFWIRQEMVCRKNPFVD